MPGQTVELRDLCAIGYPFHHFEFAGRIAWQASSPLPQMPDISR